MQCVHVCRGQLTNAAKRQMLQTKQKSRSSVRAPYRNGQHKQHTIQQELCGTIRNEPLTQDCVFKYIFYFLFTQTIPLTKLLLSPWNNRLNDFHNNSFHPSRCTGVIIKGKYHVSISTIQFQQFQVSHSGAVGQTLLFPV